MLQLLNMKGKIMVFSSKFFLLSCLPENLPDKGTKSPFSTKLYSLKTFIFLCNSYRKKVSISFLHVCSFFPHISVAIFYEPNIILVSHMWYFYILPISSKKKKMLKILILSFFLKRNQFGNNYFDIIYITCHLIKNVLA